LNLNSPPSSVQLASHLQYWNGEFGTKTSLSPPSLSFFDLFFGFPSLDTQYNGKKTVFWAISAIYFCGVEGVSVSFQQAQSGNTATSRLVSAHLLSSMRLPRGRFAFV
jgi:hypothetical protein